MESVARPRKLAFGPRASLALVVALLAAGCVTWKDGSGGTAAVLARNPERIRVTLVSGHQLELGAPVIRGDSLHGTTYGRILGVPLADVRQVQVRGFAHGRTALLVGAGVTTTALAVENPRGSKDRPDESRRLDPST